MTNERGPSDALGQRAAEGDGPSHVQGSAWLPPSERRGLPKWLRYGCMVVVVLFLLAPLVATAILDQTGTPGSGLRTVGFGTGGDECELTGVTSSFPSGMPIHVVAAFDPSLTSGTTVRIVLRRNGTDIVGAPETVRIDEPTDCMYGTYESLGPGDYEVRYEIDPSEMPALVGSFSVT
jgi:hypothetical protein